MRKLRQEKYLIVKLTLIAFSDNKKEIKISLQIMKQIKSKKI